MHLKYRKTVRRPESSNPCKLPQTPGWWGGAGYLLSETLPRFLPFRPHSAPLWALLKPSAIKSFIRYYQQINTTTGKVAYHVSHRDLACSCQAMFHALVVENFASFPLKIMTMLYVSL